MDFDSLFDTNYDLPVNDVEMDKDEYLDKVNQIFSIIDSTYSKAWTRVRLKDDEYPNEDICEKCTGCGSTIVNGETVECIANREEGECHYVLFDSDEFGISVGELMSDIWELLPVNKLK